MTKKGDKKMDTLKLKDLESRVNRNYKKCESTVNRVTSQIKNKKLHRGRVRPKDSVEAKILAKFHRK